MLYRLILTAALALTGLVGSFPCGGIAPAIAQVPAPVPALPDTERRVAYSITAQTGPFAVPFALYGPGIDYTTWIEVWLNGTRLVGGADWTLSMTGGTFTTAARPITTASVTLTAASTGTLQIIGARRPNRTAQFAENRGVAARDLNQALTDIVAQNREAWDRTNDVTGRAIMVPPGETLNALPAASARVNQYLFFDASGQPTLNPGTAGAGVFPTLGVSGQSYFGPIAAGGDKRVTISGAFPKTTATGNQNLMLISNDAIANNPLALSAQVIGSATSSLRRGEIQVSEFGLGTYHDLALQSLGGNVVIGLPFGTAPSALLDVHGSGQIASPDFLPFLPASVWTQSFARIGNLYSSTYQEALAINQVVPLSADIYPAYEADALHVSTRTADPSNVNSHDAVAIAAYGIVASTNVNGRAWGLFSQGSIENGGDGTLNGHELSVKNFGSSQPLVATTTSKYNLNLTTEGNPATVGIFFNPSGPGWHKGIYAEPASFTGASGSQFIELLGKFAVAKTGTLTISPAANTGLHGLDIVQSGPIAGTAGGTSTTCAQGGQTTLMYNSVCMSAEASNITGGTGNPGIVLFNVGLVTGGLNSEGNKAAFNAQLLHNAASNATVGRDNVAAGFGAYSTASEGGTNTGGGAKGTLFAQSAGAVLQAGATNYFLVTANEFAVGIQTGASAANRFGSSFVDNGDLQAASLDAAIEVGSTTASPGWKAGILFSNVHGKAPIWTSGAVIGTDGSANTVDTIIEALNYTATSYLLRFNNFQVTGAGVANLYGGSFAGSTSGALLVKAAAIASGTLTLPAGTTDFSATGGASQVVKQTSAGGAFTVARLACADLSDSGTGCSAGSGITALTGDVTAAGPGSAAATIANNAVTLAKLATQATNTVLGNATSGTAVPTALAVGTCSTAGSALIWTTNTGFGCNNSITANAVAVGGITGLGTGVAAFLATPSSTNLISAVTDETGTGALVFADTPTLVTPIIGAATGTSVALTGKFSSTVAFGTGWTIDASGQTPVSVANGANTTMASAAGMVFAHDTTNNDMALYICAGGACARVSDTSGNWENNTTTPAGGKKSMGYNGAVYAIYNNSGGTIDLKAAAIELKSAP